MKPIIFILPLFYSISIFAQFHLEAGTGYAFSTQKSKMIFYQNNYFEKIGNIFTGIFYKASGQYTFKNNFGIELNLEYNPKAMNILNNSKSILKNSDGISFNDGSYFMIIPRATYQYKIQNFDVSVGLGLSVNILNYYSFNYYYNESKKYSQGQLVYYYIYKKERLYKFVEEQYRLNVSLKLNYAIRKNISMFLEANANSKLAVYYVAISKIIQEKIRVENFDINQNPNLTITESEKKNVNLRRHITYPYYFDKDVYKASDLSKLIFTQIGLRYTFGKKE